jgi:alpha-L-fucosidase
MLLPGQANVTQDEYEDMAIDLVTELWTQFGNLTEIWLDGGCGSMCDRVAALIPTTLAKDAIAFNGGGDPPVSSNPVRWCGTESGSPDKGEGGAVWSTADCGWCPSGSGAGSPPNATDALWYPSGVDVTLQLDDHWFYTPTVGVHSLSDLVSFYHNSVGSNGHLELDFAIDRTGGIAPDHAARYREFGQWINSCYSTSLGDASLPSGSNVAVIDLGSNPQTVDRVMMMEDQTNGQKVISYTTEYLSDGGEWLPFSDGVTIGSKRIDIVAKAVTTTSIRLTITSAYSSNLDVSISVFSPDGCVVSN